MERDAGVQGQPSLLPRRLSRNWRRVARLGSDARGPAYVVGGGTTHAARTHDALAHTHRALLLPPSPQPDELTVCPQAGALVLVSYGFIPTLQPIDDFGR